VAQPSVRWPGPEGGEGAATNNKKQRVLKGNIMGGSRLASPSDASLILAFAEKKRGGTIKVIQAASSVPEKKVK